MTYEAEHPASSCKSYEILKLTKWCILRPNPLLGVILPFLWRTAVSRALTKRIQRCVVAAFGRTSLRRICRAYFTGASPCGRQDASIRVLSPPHLSSTYEWQSSGGCDSRCGSSRRRPSLSPAGISSLLQGITLRISGLPAFSGVCAVHSFSSRLT